MMNNIVKACVLCFLFSLSVSVLAQAQAQETRVLIHTDKGKITIKLYNETPLHRDNFIKLVQTNQYNDLLFHRVISQYMIQAGDINSKDALPETILGSGDLDYTIPAEIVYPRFFHKNGQLCAARTGDDVNPERASSGSQFYIVTGKFYTENELNKIEEERSVKLTDEQRHAYMFEGGTPYLDGEYTVFGEVEKGMKVVDKIQQVLTDINDRPLKNIKIRSMKITK